MTDHIEQLGGKPAVDANKGGKIQVIDAGVPTARVMSELLAMPPPGIRLDLSVCVNPFDPRWPEEIDICHKVADAAHSDRCASNN